MTVKKETEETPEDVKEIMDQTTTEIKTKYVEIEKYCDDEDHFNNVIQELVMFEIVLNQINQIFVDTLYNPEANILLGAAKDSVESLCDSFAAEFILQSHEKETLSALPDLAQAVAWVEELHGNIAKQLFTEDFHKEVLAPSYEKIAEAINEVSQGQQENVEDIEVTHPSQEAEDSKGE